MSHAEDLIGDDEFALAVIERLRAENEHLQEALRSARVIGAAVGIIMATTKGSYEQGFRDLATASQHRNVKVRLLAERVVLSGELR